MELHLNDVGAQNRQLSAAALEQKEFRVQNAQKEAQRKQAAAAKAKEKRKETVDPEIYLKDILTITSIFNRKLKFSINRESNQVIVKVIDGETDNVIKEIPPEALQRLHSRMRESIGLLIDEEI
ncbi:MAG: flagellar protein FlaG [Spirochaetaceae bacterium]|nr:flagellar protein FlaG [Spirochaetaceae bacterium]MCF7948080.1 flagellar protein FlaG [Spirochaetia bacterium]MCF7950441.1 flagellar protein FlaG [Spirochaetaceae bacterium]